MKKIFLLIIFTIPFVTFSQNATKSQEKRSDMITSYVIDKLELSEEDAQFFQKIRPQISTSNIDPIFVQLLFKNRHPDKRKIIFLTFFSPLATFCNVSTQKSSKTDHIST